MKPKNLMLSAVCALVLAVPAFAQKVTVNYDATVDFSRYKRYAFLQSNKPSASMLCHQAVLGNIQLKLAIRGLLPAHSGERPDLWIVYNAGIKELISIQGYNYQYGPEWRWSLGASHARESALVEEPQTLVDLVDAGENRLVWRGIATGTLVQDSERTVKNIENATKKMFANYPLNR